MDKNNWLALSEDVEQLLGRIRIVSFIDKWPSTREKCHPHDPLSPFIVQYVFHPLGTAFPTLGNSDAPDLAREQELCCAVSHPRSEGSRSKTE